MNHHALAVVPVDPGDGGSSFRELRGVPLVTRAVSALVRSGVVERVVVACPQALVPALIDVTASLAGLTGAAVDVTATAGPGPGDRLLAVLTQGDADDAAGTVVVHDPLHPLASAQFVRDVVQRLAADPAVAAAVPVRPVTDTLKWVDEGVVRATADRQQFRMVYSPQAYRVPALLAALRAADDRDRSAIGADVLPRLVQRAGGRLVSVPAPGEVFRIATAEDIQLAEAMLHVGADRDDEPAAAHRG